MAQVPHSLRLNRPGFSFPRIRVGVPATAPGFGLGSLPRSQHVNTATMMVGNVEMQPRDRSVDHGDLADQGLRCWDDQAMSSLQA